MIIFPGCKINLGLSVLSKRQDGFHNIESILYPVPLFDILEILPAKENFAFKISGQEIPGNPMNNLVVKAFNLIDREHHVGPVEIILYKNIPSGAGLGGGSSDAAHTILLLNELFSLKLSISQMEEYARGLGSDCAFFIQNNPVLARDKGDQFISIDLSIDSHQLFIVKPNLHINTEQAYSWLKPKSGKIDLKDLKDSPVESWSKLLINDFEIPVFSKYPKLKELKDRLLDLGASYASMTGTGSAVFGLFKKNIDLPTQSDFPGDLIWSDKPHVSGSNQFME